MPRCSLKWASFPPTAASACRRVWHLSIIINFKDAVACVCHSLCWFLNFHRVFFFIPRIFCSFTRLPHQVGTLRVLQVVSISFLFCSPASPQENQLGKHPLRNNPPRHTWHLWSEDVLGFSAIVHLNVTVRITVWYADRPISPDLSCHCLPILLVSQNGAHTERKLKKAGPTLHLHTVWISSHLVLLESATSELFLIFAVRELNPSIREFDFHLQRGTSNT